MILTESKCNHSNLIWGVFLIYYSYTILKKKCNQLSGTSFLFLFHVKVAKEKQNPMSNFRRTILTGMGYLNILQEAIRVAINSLRPDEVAEVWYQQDGAPPHNTKAVSDLLYQTFEDRWIANNGPHHWPARSPDLTPLDTSIWGCIKSKVYQEPPTTKQNMIQRVLGAFNSMDPQYISRATGSNIIRRILKCLEVNGSNFEHLLWNDASFHE